MTSCNPECFHESASSILAFKECPQLYRLKYREGLRPAIDTDSQRIGTNWHALHEVYANAFQDRFGQYITHGVEDEASCREEAKTTAIESVVTHLNERYEQMPASKTAFEWGLERQILLTSFIGYLWFYQDDPIETLASEISFELPLHSPRTGLPLLTREVVRVGKMDHVIRWHGMVGVQERKSTTRSIAADSDYWDKSKKDTQVSMYALAFRDMMAAGVAELKAVGIEGGDYDRVGNTLYDCWHRPTIKPSMLTQKETAEFIKTETYCDQKFDVEEIVRINGDPAQVKVDGEPAEIEPGKKGFAVKETVAMFGARLLQDIYARPDFYYARREIARTDAEIRKFRGELYNIYQAKRLYARTGFWWENERQCRATRSCDMIPICYGPGADAVCDGKTTPPNFTRIFVDPKQKEILPEE